MGGGRGEIETKLEGGQGDASCFGGGFVGYKILEGGGWSKTKQ